MKFSQRLDLPWFPKLPGRLPWALCGALFAGPALGDVYDCVPVSRTHCETGVCEKADSASLQAERFRLDTKTAQLSACLWSNCYRGPGNLRRDAGRHSIIATGRLRAENPAVREGMRMSFFVDTSRRIFVASYGRDDDSSEVDVGACQRDSADPKAGRKDARP